MKVSELLESRRSDWRALEQLCRQFEGRSHRRMPAEQVSRLSKLYRAACADLALADAYQLPPGTIHYLHQLVGRAHNQLYRSREFNVRGWMHELFSAVPRRLFHDRCLRLAMAIFWGVFLWAAATAYMNPAFAEKVLTKEGMLGMENMFTEAPDGRPIAVDGMMFCFYIANNPRIGLQCFAFGLVVGIGGLYITLYNALVLGATFGHMAQTPQGHNFFTFVTAHGPFELTAVVLSAAAGMKLGFSLINTGGYTRIASLRRAAEMAVPTAAAAFLLFIAAAMIEGFVSPSSLPYAVKAGVAIVSTAMLLFYFIFLGMPRRA